MIELPTALAFLAIVLSTFQFMLRLMSGSLTRLEHVEFKDSVLKRLNELSQEVHNRLIIREFQEGRNLIQRDFDRIEEDIRIIDGAKPTTGELKQIVEAFNLRISDLEARLKFLSSLKS